MKKKIYLDDNCILQGFYQAIREDRLESIHIPHSDVFYVRSAIEGRTGKRYTLKLIETAMKQKGWKKK